MSTAGPVAPLLVVLTSSRRTQTVNQTKRPSLRTLFRGYAHRRERERNNMPVTCPQQKTDTAGVFCCSGFGCCFVLFLKCPLLFLYNPAFTLDLTVISFALLLFTKATINNLRLYLSLQRETNTEHYQGTDE